MTFIGAQIRLRATLQVKLRARSTRYRAPRARSLRIRICRLVMPIPYFAQQPIRLELLKQSLTSPKCYRAFQLNREPAIVLNRGGVSYLVVGGLDSFASHRKGEDPNCRHHLVLSLGAGKCWHQARWAMQKLLKNFPPKQKLVPPRLADRHVPAEVRGAVVAEYLQLRVHLVLEAVHRGHGLHQRWRAVGPDNQARPLPEDKTAAAITVKLFVNNDRFFNTSNPALNATPPPTVLKLLLTDGL
jgi:hypothetical protein